MISHVCTLNFLVILGDKYVCKYLLRETRVALHELISQYIDVRCKHILILFIVDVVPRSTM